MLTCVVIRYVASALGERGISKEEGRVNFFAPSSSNVAGFIEFVGFVGKGFLRRLACSNEILSSYMESVLGMKGKMRRLVSELLKDSKRSDRELAKSLEVSQPTITRMRHALVKEGIIREFTVMPDFAKLGYEIMAVTIARAKATLTPSEQESAKKLVLREPRVIFVASAEGMGRNGVMISLHKDYADFRDFVNNLKFNSEGYMEEVDSMLISLKSSMIPKPLSFSYLAGREDF